MILKFEKLRNELLETQMYDYSNYVWGYVEAKDIEVYRLNDEFSEITMMNQKYSAKANQMNGKDLFVYFDVGYLMNDDGKTIETFNE